MEKRYEESEIDIYFTKISERKIIMRKFKILSVLDFMFLVSQDLLRKPVDDNWPTSWGGFQCEGLEDVVVLGDLRVGHYLGHLAIFEVFRAS